MRGWWLPLTTPQLLGRQLPRDPRHRARGTLSLLAGCCHVTVHARADSVAFDDDRHTDSMAGTMAFDLFAAITMGGPWQAFATVQNVLDPPVLALAGVRLR